MKSIILIALAAMLTIANTEAHPTPCDWDWPTGEVPSYCSIQKRCLLLIHPCAVRRPPIVYQVKCRDCPLEILNAVSYKLSQYKAICYLCTIDSGPSTSRHNSEELFALPESLLLETCNLKKAYQTDRQKYVITVGNELMRVERLNFEHGGWSLYLVEGC